MDSHLSAVIVKPVNMACNMSCEYCYMKGLLEPHKANCNIMSEDVLRETINFFCSVNNNIEFIWHGGEPLFAGKDFYKKVVGFQNVWRLKGKKIMNFIQTNGTLVDDSWAFLFSELGFTVGVSLDLPQKINNRLRKLKDSTCSESYDRIISGIKKLKKYDIFNGISCCVGNSNHLLVKDIMSELYQENIKSIKFLRIKNNNSCQNNSISADEYTNFLIKVFNLWIEKDDVDLEIRDIKSLVDIILGGDFRECVYLGKCGQFATVYSDGSIFPCDNFLNDTRFSFGTVHDSFSSVVSGKKFRSFIKKSESKNARCQSCQWNFVCRGGCLYERICLNEQENSDICEAKGKLFSKVRGVLSDCGLL